MNVPEDTLNWLLAGEPWVAWRSRVVLLNQPADSPDVMESHQAVLDSSDISTLVSQLVDWPAPLLNSHKSASHPLHLLSFLVDIGLTANDSGMSHVIERIFAHQCAQGPFQMMGNISPKYGGSGQDVYAWALCDAPLVLYSLVKLGLSEDARVQTAIKYLVDLVRENGWPCAVSPELGKWRGPGRKDDPCPYATLVMLKLLAEVTEYANSSQTKIGTETLLSLWERSLEQHPYIFYMGKNFRKLKAPLVWYDILHVADVLSHFTFLRTDPRLREMMQIMQTKADENGRYTPESTYQAWKSWDFGQKKVPSRYITLRVMEISQRIGDS